MHAILVSAPGAQHISLLEKKAERDEALESKAAAGHASSPLLPPLFFPIEKRKTSEACGCLLPVRSPLEIAEYLPPSQVVSSPAFQILLCMPIYIHFNV